MWLLKSSRPSHSHISYQDLAVQVNALAVALQAIDPTPQSRVGICAYNNVQHLLGWLATYAAGKTWVPLNPRNGRDELDRIINLTQPSVIIFDGACSEKFGHTTAHLMLGKPDGDTSRASSQMAHLVAAHDGDVCQCGIRPERMIYRRSNLLAGHQACPKE